MTVNLNRVIRRIHPPKKSFFQKNKDKIVLVGAMGAAVVAGAALTRSRIKSKILTRDPNTVFSFFNLDIGGSVTIESEFKYVMTVVATAGKRSTKTEVFKCLKCYCLVDKADRRFHRETQHPPKVQIQNETINVEIFKEGTW